MVLWRLIISSWLVAGFTITVLVCQSHGDTKPNCEVLDRCSCKVQGSGKIISLQEIDKRSGPRFTDIGDGSFRAYKYFYSPCTPLNYKDYKSILVYQTGEGGIYYNLGAAKLSVTPLEDSYMFSYVGKNEDNQDRTTQITLKCDSSATDPKIDLFSESQTQYTYTSTLTSKCACEDGCRYDPNYFSQKTTGKSGKLSIGSVLCIVLLVLVVVYLTAGILLNKYAMNRRGMDTVPNWKFWKDFPFLVKDGISFIYTYLKEGPCNRATYSQIE